MKKTIPVFLLAVLSCASPVAEKSKPVAGPLQAQDQSKLDEELRSVRETIRRWSFRCFGSSSKLVGPNTNDFRNKCSLDYPFTGDGDSTLWNGLLCSTGNNPWACEAVARSINDNGQVFRSPRRKLTNNDGNPYPQAPFSRDMARGVLLYLLQTNDREFLKRWAGYIQRTGGLCEDHTDLSCDLRNQFLNNLNAVSRQIGGETVSPCTMPVCLWPLHPLNELVRPSIREMRAENNESYHLHLLAVDLYINSKLKNPLIQEDDRKELACTIYKRKPVHLFYKYLCEGVSADLKVQILKLAPVRRPAFLSQWVWEREIPDGYFDEAGGPKHTFEAMKLFAHRESMGWDFIFLIDLVLNDSQ